MRALVELGTLENRVQLLYFLVLPEGRVSQHEVVNVDHPPRPEPKLPQPFHVCLQFIGALEGLHGRHLALHHGHMLPSVNIPGDVELGDIEAQGALDADQHPQQHPVVARVDLLVLLWVDEFLVAVGQVSGGVGDEPHFFGLGVLDVLLGVLVLVPVNGQPSQAHRVHYLALLLDFLHVVGVLLNFNCEIFSPGLIDGLQRLGLEPLFPVLIHVLLIAIGYRVQRGLKHLEQVVGDPRSGDAIVLHDPIGQIGKTSFILIVGAAYLDRELDLTVNQLLSVAVGQLQLLQPVLHLLLDLLLGKDHIFGRLEDLAGEFYA